VENLPQHGVRLGHFSERVQDSGIGCQNKSALFDISHGHKFEVGVFSIFDFVPRWERFLNRLTQIKKRILMAYEKNDKVSVQTRTGKMTGMVRDRFIQNTELEISKKTLKAEATSENPIYLVEFDNGDQELIAEHSISLRNPHAETEKDQPYTRH
jgi:hypothetical protein